jgi:UDP-N-acetylglucosamine 4,6-dehydratase
LNPEQPTTNNQQLKGKSILITGGTGSFGRAFVERVLRDYKAVARLLVFSRDELKQWELRQQYPENEYPQLQFMLGDVRDKERLEEACEGIDILIHAAALKHAPLAEANPMEFVKTNVQGTEHVVKAALRQGVEKLIGISTDKVAAPAGVYGASKLLAERIILEAASSKDVPFSIVRLGNLLGSSGSVSTVFEREKSTGVLPVTHPEAFRYFISLEQGVDMLFLALREGKGGEVFIPTKAK